MSDDGTETPTDVAVSNGIEIARLVRQHVRAAVYAPDDVVAVVRRSFGPDQVDDGSLAQWVADAFDAHDAEQADWPDETDADRLDLTFAQLQCQGVLALPDAGETAGEAVAAAARRYADAGGDQSGIVGFCFYLRDDLLRVADEGELLLGFGDVDGDDDAAVAVGHRIVDALDADGFTVAWDGTRGQRVAVTHLDWQRRPG